MPSVNQITGSSCTRTLDTAKSVDDFLRVLAPFNQRALAELARIKDDRPPYLFRGDKSNRELVASIGKYWRDGLDGFERKMLRHLRDTFKDFMNVSDWDLIALAQHHGVATRYLDWTSDALVALTFALGEKRGVDELPVVWVLETRGDDFDIPANEVSPFSVGMGISTKIFSPSTIDCRIVAQNSYMMRQVFVQKDNGKTCEIEPVDANPTFAKRIWKIPIALKRRQSMLADLKRLGYTMDTMLPKIDFERLSDECNEIMNGLMPDSIYAE